MKNFIALLGASALLSAGIDVLHGQHNGDVHRTYIHGVESALFASLFGVLTLQAYKLLRKKLELSIWSAGLLLSLGSLVFGFALFGLSGGSAHGDGGPIAATFGIFGFAGLFGVPISFVGWIIAWMRRERQALPRR